MKLFATLLLILAFPVFAFAKEAKTAKEIKAKTDSGKSVILYDNGTWKYVEEPKGLLTEKSFNKPENATTEYKSKRGNFTFYYNPDKWTVVKAGLNPMAELSLSQSSGDAYAMIISERTRIPLENFEQIVLENAKNAAPDAEITKSESRIVNGKLGRFIEFTGTLQGITFVYNYYLFSDTNGSTQILAFTSQELYPEFAQDFQDLLNGYVGH